MLWDTTVTVAVALAARVGPANLFDCPVFGAVALTTLARIAHTLQQGLHRLHRLHLHPQHQSCLTTDNHPPADLYRRPESTSSVLALRHRQTVTTGLVLLGAPVFFSGERAGKARPRSSRYRTTRKHHHRGPGPALSTFRDSPWPWPRRGNRFKVYCDYGATSHHRQPAAGVCRRSCPRDGPRR